MAKTLKVKTGTEIKGTMVGLTINPAFSSSVQVGDVFYVPRPDAFVVLGQAIDDLDRSGNVQVDENGNVKRRSVGQRIVAVKIIDGKADSVQELYLGQIIKMDYQGRAVFNNELSRAYRSANADTRLKELMCGKILEVVEEGVCEDRIWSNGDASKGISAGYLRDENKKFLHEPKPCFKWATKVAPATVDKDACDDMIVDYVNDAYGEEDQPLQE